MSVHGSVLTLCNGLHALREYVPRAALWPWPGSVHGGEPSPALIARKRLAHGLGHLVELVQGHKGKLGSGIEIRSL